MAALICQYRDNRNVDLLGSLKVPSQLWQKIIDAEAQHRVAAQRKQHNESSTADPTLLLPADDDSPFVAFVKRLALYKYIQMQFSELNSLANSVLVLETDTKMATSKFSTEPTLFSMIPSDVRRHAFLNKIQRSFGTLTMLAESCAQRLTAEERQQLSSEQLQIQCKLCALDLQMRLQGKSSTWASEFVRVMEAWQLQLPHELTNRNDEPGNVGATSGGFSKETIDLSSSGEEVELLYKHVDICREMGVDLATLRAHHFFDNFELADVMDRVQQQKKKRKIGETGSTLIEKLVLLQRQEHKNGNM